MERMSRQLLSCLFVLVCVTVTWVIYFSSSVLPTWTGSKGVSIFLAAGRETGLELFLVEPDLLREIESGRTKRGQGKREATHGLTFGVIDPSTEALEQLSGAVHTQLSFYRHVIYDVDPRGVSVNSFIDRKRLPTIPMHFLWWSRDENTISLLLHLVIFRTRGAYLWHGQLSPATIGDFSGRQSLPFPTPKLMIGQEGALVDRFEIREEDIGGEHLSLPANIPSFLRSLEDGALVECNHDMARYVVKNYDRKLLVANAHFQKSIVDMMAAVSKTLDDLGLPFWICGGTFLGWYRQCDVIPYTVDADIGMMIEDYTPELIKAFEQAGLRLWRRLGKVENCFELTFIKEFRIDVFFRYQSEDGNSTFICMFKAATFEKYRYDYPKHSLRWADFAGVKVRVPYPPERYLVPAYGKNWFKPKADYHWLTDPNNAKKDGYWPEEERKDLRKMYVYTKHSLRWADLLCRGEGESGGMVV